MTRPGQAMARAGAFLMTIGAALAHADAPALPADGGVARARRLLVVVSDEWSSHDATLRRFERSPGGKWLAVGDAIPVALGRTGLGWGDGLAPRPAAVELDGPTKVEGDARSPAGVFALSEVTGYDAAPPPGLTLPYRTATPALRCVDDGAAPAYYNRIVDAPPQPPWGSAERMRRDDGLYRFTVFVRHNAARTPGHGSCVFLHVWRRPGAPTVGCTAMALPALTQLLPWLDDTTLLVQLPRPAYDGLQRAWDLPPLPPAQRK